MAICKDCDGELQRKEIVGGSTRVNKDGRCRICAEVHGEAEADDAEALAKAQRIIQKRRAK